MASGQDPMLPMWSPTRCPGPLPKDSMESIHSGPDTVRGFSGSKIDSDRMLMTPPFVSSDEAVIKHDSLPVLTRNDITSSLCALSSSHEESQLDLSDLELLFFFS